ncbi:hypothetical protein WKI68_39130 [Streptomyces sp. MS1.HAVA.3]|uniref:Uncharacterized protein n=1 Tax=Streptomyces caledonius TaxID=3134107 RepID=A0ABU8UDN4_9ACTN
MQRQWQPAQSRRQLPGLLGGAGHGSSVQQDLPRRSHRQRLQWQQLCARTQVCSLPSRLVTTSRPRP